MPQEDAEGHAHHDRGGTPHVLDVCDGDVHSVDTSPWWPFASHGEWAEEQHRQLIHVLREYKFAASGELYAYQPEVC